MPGQTPISKPEFIISGSDENVLVKHLEEDIFARPEAYQTVLALGNIAAQNSETESPVEGDVIKRVRDFFEHRLDREVMFDDATEDALQSDIVHSDYIKAMKGAQNPEKRIEYREKARYNRFGFFVDRVIKWQLQPKNSLPRTG